MKCAVFILASLFLPGSVSVARDFYISPSGCDNNPGTQNKPFVTLERARDGIRKLKETRGLPAGGVTVWLHGGRYLIEKPFELAETDSGEKGSPVVYRAVGGQHVRLIGGRVLTSSDFKPLTDQAVLDRMIEPSARSNVLQCDLKALGISDLGQRWPDRFRGLLKTPSLFCDGQTMRVARWPNEGWAHVEKVLERGSRPRHKETPDRPGKVRMEQRRVARWAASVEDGVWLNGYWAFDAYDETLRVSKIDGREISFVEPHYYGIGHGHPGPRRYYATNLIEELDDPGEYFLDTKRALLYFIPPAPIQQCEIILTQALEPLFQLQNASYVTFRGLSFEATSAAAIRISGGHHNLIAGCAMRSINGHRAVELLDGTKNKVLSCDISQVSGVGVYCRGGDRKSLTPGEHLVENCHIHHYGTVLGGAAVELRGVGNTARHNLIHHGGGSVALGGNNHLAELNEFHNMCDGKDDGGAFYTFRGWSNCGSVLRNNYFHDITGLNEPGKGHGVMGVYLDGASGYTIDGNVFYKAGTRAALFSNSGGPNIFTNNLFIDCRRAIQQKGIERINDALTASINEQRRWLENIGYRQGPWKQQFPHLESMFDDFLENGMSPRGTVIANNVFTGCKENLSLQPFHNDPAEITLVKQMTTIRDNVEMDKAEIGFIDALGKNWQIKKDSTVYKKVGGFKAIPFDKIGLYDDEYRTAP